VDDSSVTLGDRQRFEAFARTIGLDEFDVAVSATLRPGTLAAPSAPVPSSAVAPALPRLDAARGSEAGRSELSLQRVLGEGGMGIVWLARQRSLDREVAVKGLKGTPSTESARALLHEARVTGALEHPGVVPVHALGLDAEGAPLLVMKRVEGATLEALRADPDHPAWPALMRRYGDRLSSFVEILSRVADALELAHARGYVHRDVKPENVMVGPFGEVYLLDWGIALSSATLAEEERTRASIVGTPTFMAPELVVGLAAGVGPTTDVYLLGATLHTLLTGRPRHEGETLHAVLLAALLSEPPVRDPETPSELAALVRRATAADPGDRPPSAAAFREALGEFARHRSSLRLAHDATAKLDASEPSPSVPDRVTRLLECRFAFRRALEEWPSNDVAERGLRRTLRSLALAEIARRSPDAADAFVRELDAPDAELDEKIAALRDLLREAERLEAAAREEERQRDPTVGAGARVILGGVLMATGLSIALAAPYFETPDERALSLVSLAVNCGFVAVLGLALFLARGHLLANRAARHTVLAIFLAAMFFVVSQAAAVVLGTSELDATIAAHLTLAAALAGASLSVGAPTLIAALVILAGAGLIVAMPEHASPIQQATFVLAIGSFVASAYATRRVRPAT
jgi:serine/threonine-protein kinase